MKEIVNRLMENRQIELAKEIMESAGYTVSQKLNEAEEHPGWEYWEMPKDWKGPWSANMYTKDVKGLEVSIYPPQRVPGEDKPTEDWHAEVQAADGRPSSVDKYETGFKSFEEAEAWINSQIEKYDPEGDKVSYNQKRLQYAIDMLSKAVASVPSELRDEFTSQAIEILQSHK